MNNIERYIEFAKCNELIIDGHQITDFDLSIDEGEVCLHQTDTNFYQNTIELITSKEFIESVSIGLEELGVIKGTRRMNIGWITKMQAISIRDNTLDTFIESILPKQK